MGVGGCVTHSSAKNNVLTDSWLCIWQKDYISPDRYIVLFPVTEKRRSVVRGGGR